MVEDDAKMVRCKLGVSTFKEDLGMDSPVDFADFRRRTSACVGRGKETGGRVFVVEEKERVRERERGRK